VKEFRVSHQFADHGYSHIVQAESSDAAVLIACKRLGYHSITLDKSGQALVGERAVRATAITKAAPLPILVTVKDFKALQAA
jgi:hypothetical protein